MTRFAYLLAMLAIATSLLLAYFNLLPPSPFASAINDLVTFLSSDTVSQGLSWLAWFFPTTNFINWIPGIVNAIIAFNVARLTLLVLRLHA